MENGKEILKIVTRTDERLTNHLDQVERDNLPNRMIAQEVFKGRVMTVAGIVAIATPLIWGIYFR